MKHIENKSSLKIQFKIALNVNLNKENIVDRVIRVPKSKQKEYTKALRQGGLPKYVKIEGM